MTEHQRRIELRLRHPRSRHRVVQPFGEWIEHADNRRGEQRQADVVNGPRHTVAAGTNVLSGHDGPGANQVRGIGVVVGEMDVAVECNRPGDHQVVRLVARARERAVRDESPDDQNGDAEERGGGLAVRHPYSGMLPCFFGGFLSRLCSRVASA